MFGVFLKDPIRLKGWPMECDRSPEGRMAPAFFLLTQGVEDPCHEVEAHKHGHPASCPQAPCLHGIALLFSTKHFL